MRGIVLKDHEMVIRILRPSGFEYIFSWMCGSWFIAMGFFLLFPLLAMQEVGITVLVFLVLFGLCMLLRALYLWSTNTTIITNRRVISVKRTGPLSKAFSEIELSKIHDVSYSVHGLKQTLFGFGDVTLQNEANRQQQFVIPTVRQPHQVQNLINELREKLPSTVEASPVKTVIAPLNL